MDYKINQYHARTLFVEVDSARFANHTRAMFDENFTKLPFQNSAENLPTTESVQKPQNLSEIVRVAQMLGESLGFVRVDLYSVQRRVIVGELTFTPAGGASFFTPQEWDKKWGAALV